MTGPVAAEPSELRRARRVPMTWADYLELPEKPKAEWVDGVAVISPSFEVLRHGLAQAEIADALSRSLPELDVLIAAALRLPWGMRQPDIVVVPAIAETTDTTADTDWVEDAPLLVVEVLSPSSLMEDLVVKSVEYLRAGVEQYWTVDPDERYLEVSRRVDGQWRFVLRLDDAHPTGEVAVGEHGVVPLDLADILGPPRPPAGAPLP